MGNSLLAVRGINHKYIVVGGGKVRFADRADGKTGGSNGAVKSAESDALGAENE